MSDFLSGVGAGLVGSNGIGSLAKTLTMAPYLAAMQEQKARSQAAVEALNAAKLDEINRRHTANNFWAGKSGVPVEALGGYSPTEVSQLFSNAREGQMMYAAGMLGGKQPTGATQPTGSVQPIGAQPPGGVAETKAQSEANIQRNAPVLKQLMQDSGGIAHALKGGSMYQRTNDGAAFNTFYGTSEVSDKEVRNLYRQEKQAGIAKDRAQAAHYRTSSGGGGTSGKPLPIGAVKMQQDHLEAIGAGASLAADLEAVAAQIANGGLDLGPMNNTINRGRNFLGLSSEQSRNFASLEANLERLRNESLRLNKGVQTEGDAQRAWNELFRNLNDNRVVLKRLNEIININRRAVDLRKNELDVVRANYGRGPLQTRNVEGVRTAVVGNVLTPGSVDSGYEYLGGDPAQPSSWRKL